MREAFHVVLRTVCLIALAFHSTTPLRGRRAFRGAVLPRRRGRRVPAAAGHRPADVRAGSRSSRTSPCSTRPPGTAWSKGRPGAPGGSRTATGRPTAPCRFWQEPYVTFLQNSQDLWFDQMGDGKTRRPFGEVQVGAARRLPLRRRPPGWFISKQGDGRVDIHDWGMEFTAAGVVMQAEAAAGRPRRKGHRATTCRSWSGRPNFIEIAPRPEEQPLPGRAGRQPAGPQLRRLEEARRHVRQGLPGRPVDHLHRRAWTG